MTPLVDVSPLSGSRSGRSTSRVIVPLGEALTWLPALSVTGTGQAPPLEVTPFT